ncbi:MAG: hypothetical protein KC635_09190 [Myxococcales bacterium]|nr:hypothetical protein [Myxococcales bacterium]MCB9731925.1 hypothetical protein [Deltaproteobacteria bacterium]
MSLPPSEYTKLKAFRDLIAKTVDRLGQAQSQGTLAQAANDSAASWDGVDGDFAGVLRGVANNVWQGSFAQVRPTVQAIIGHLQGQLKDIDAQLR